MNDLWIAATELLPLDAGRREDALVHLAFMAQAAVVPALAGAADGAAQRLREPLPANRLCGAGGRWRYWMTTPPRLPLLLFRKPIGPQNATV